MGTLKTIGWVVTGLIVATLLGTWLGVLDVNGIR